MHPPFHRCRRPRPILDRFVCDGSDPPALAAVTDNWRFGRAVDDNNDGLPSHSQSVSNIDRVMTSSSCLLSLLISVIFIAILIPLPKLAEDNIQEIFHVGVAVILRCNTRQHRYR